MTKKKARMPDRFPNLSAPTTAATIEDDDKISTTKQGKKYF